MRVSRTLCGVDMTIAYDACMQCSSAVEVSRPRSRPPSTHAPTRLLAVQALQVELALRDGGATFAGAECKVMNEIAEAITYMLFAGQISNWKTTVNSHTRSLRMCRCGKLDTQIQSWAGHSMSRMALLEESLWLSQISLQKGRLRKVEMHPCGSRSLRRFACPPSGQIFHKLSQRTPADTDHNHVRSHVIAFSQFLVQHFLRDADRAATRAAKSTMALPI